MSASSPGWSRCPNGLDLGPPRQDPEEDPGSGAPGNGPWVTTIAPARAGGTARLPRSSRPWQPRLFGISGIAAVLSGDLQGGRAGKGAARFGGRDGVGPGGGAGRDLQGQFAGAVDVCRDRAEGGGA